MNILLWVLQILLALHTTIGAVWKFSNSEQTVPSLKAIPHGVWLAMSVVELLFSLALILPALHKPLAILAPIAAACIAVEMLLFCAVHVYSMGGGGAAANATSIHVHNASIAVAALGFISIPNICRSASFCGTTSPARRNTVCHCARRDAITVSFLLHLNFNGFGGNAVCDDFEQARTLLLVHGNVE